MAGDRLRCNRQASSEFIWRARCRRAVYVLAPCQAANVTKRRSGWRLASKLEPANKPSILFSLIARKLFESKWPEPVAQLVVRPPSPRSSPLSGHISPAQAPPMLGQRKLAINNCAQLAPGHLFCSCGRAREEKIMQLLVMARGRDFDLTSLFLCPFNWLHQLEPTTNSFRGHSESFVPFKSLPKWPARFELKIQATLHAGWLRAPPLHRAGAKRKD